MRPILLVLGVLLIGAGAVFVAQGLDLPFAPASFMTADRAWVLIGAIVVVAGVVLVGWSRQRGDAAPE
jgi:peptidoglycan/LPS O-acetylase OafA/YrhL